MPSTPCKGCQERFVGCHSTCEKYAQMRKEIDELNEKRRKAVSERVAYNEYFTGVYDRTTSPNYNYLFKKSTVRRSKKK